MDVEMPQFGERNCLSNGHRQLQGSAPVKRFRETNNYNGRAEGCGGVWRGLSSSRYALIDYCAFIIVRHTASLLCAL